MEDKVIDTRAEWQKREECPKCHAGMPEFKNYLNCPNCQEPLGREFEAEYLGVPKSLPPPRGSK